MSSADHFSQVAAGYCRYRPDYPRQLIEHFVRLLTDRRLAWDVGTGNGQVARQLAGFFQHGVATDVSAEQLAQAHAPGNVTFQQGRAEQSGLEPGSVDLVTVGQALHWFAVDRFYQEVARVLATDGLIAVWCYQLLSVTPEIDELIQRLYHQILGADWPPERRHIDSGYRELPFPFQELNLPRWSMTKRWSFEHLVGYLRTWSAVDRFATRTGLDPLAKVLDRLQRAWGAGQIRSVNWPLVVRLGRLRYD